MDKEKIAQIVKDVKSLGLEAVKQIPTLVTQITKDDGKDLVHFFNSFSEKFDLDNESKAILVQHLIEVRKVHTCSTEHKKVLKELVKQPSLKSYLQGLIF